MQSYGTLTPNACLGGGKCSIKVDLSIPHPNTTNRHVVITNSGGTVVYEADLAANVVGFIISDLPEPETYSIVVRDTVAGEIVTGPPGSCSVKCVLTPVDPTKTPTDPYQ